MSSFHQAMEHPQIPSIMEDMGRKRSKHQFKVRNCMLFEGMN